MTPLALDIAIGLIILLSTVVAYMRGLIKEIFTVAGFGAAIFFAYESGHLLIPQFNQWLHVPDGADTGKTELVMGLLSPSLAAKVFSYGGMFLIAFIIIMLLGRLLTRWVNEAGLGIVDRLLGGTFGFLRGFLLVFMLYVPCTYLIDQKKMPEWATQSTSVPILQKTLTVANEYFELDKKIEDRGGGIAIKFDKVDLDKLGAKVHPAEEELKEAIKKEEKEIQKGTPDIQPDKLIDQIGKAISPSDAPPAAPPAAPPVP